MPRKKLSIPAYSLHKSSGQARVRVNGKDHYLGLYGSEESRIAYGKLISQPQSQIDPLAETDASISVAELLVAFKAHAEAYYVKNGRKTSEVDCFYSAMRPIRNLFGLISVDEFGPQQMKAVRSAFVDSGWTRKFVNKSVNRVRQIWKWGVSCGMVNVTTWQSLLSVEPLKAGRTEAPDRKPRKAVDEERIQAARSQLAESEQMFFDLLRWSGARPSELIDLTMDGINTTGPIWVAELADHKCAHLDKDRKVWFGPKCQEVLKRCPQKGVMFAFSRKAFSARMKVACAAAGITPFVPYELRHSAATAARDALSLEASQGLLGHSKPDMTTTYTKKLDSLAAQVAAIIG